MPEEIKSFVQVDPKTCSIEDLKKEVARLYDLTEFYESKQLAIKLFLNSVYGATANRFFVGYNINLAEAITLQGQDLNHFSERCVNKYFSGIFQNDKDLHKKLGINSDKALKFNIDCGRVTQQGPLTGPEFDYMPETRSMTVAGDTDSCAGDTKIYVDNQKVNIEDAYEQIKEENFDSGMQTSSGAQIIPNRFNHLIKTFDPDKKEIVERSIKYIMRHKVTKARFKIKTKSGKEVVVTGDHSIMVIRDGNLISVKAKDIKNGDKVVTLKNNNGKD